jgi:hypothetical protein
MALHAVATIRYRVEYENNHANVLEVDLGPVSAQNLFENSISSRLPRGCARPRSCWYTPDGAEQGDRRRWRTIALTSPFPSAYSKLYVQFWSTDTSAHSPNYFTVDSCSAQRGLAQDDASATVAAAGTSTAAAPSDAISAGPWVHSIVVDNFCSFSHAEFSLPSASPVTAFVGSNGSGKTNVMKALWMWSAARRVMDEHAAAAGRDDDAGRAVAGRRRRPALLVSRCPWANSFSDLLFNDAELKFAVTLTASRSPKDPRATRRFEFEPSELGQVLYLCEANVPLKVETEAESKRSTLPAIGIVVLLDASAVPGRQVDENTWHGHTGELLARPSHYIRRICSILSQRFPESWALLKQGISEQFRITLHDVVTMEDRLALHYTPESSCRRLEISQQGGGFVRTLATLAAASAAVSSCAWMNLTRTWKPRGSYSLSAG